MPSAIAATKKGLSLSDRGRGRNSCPEAHCPMVRWPCAGGALYGLQAARAEAGRLPRWPERTITFFARWWWCRGARSVAPRVLCAAPDAALRVPFVVPDAVQRAPLAVPDAARYQTSRYPWAASWAWWASWWLGLQPATPAELPTKRVQKQPRVQGKRVRCDDRPVSVPNVHPFSGSRFSAPEHVTNVERLALDLNQPGHAGITALRMPS